MRRVRTRQATIDFDRQCSWPTDRPYTHSRHEHCDRAGSPDHERHISNRLDQAADRRKRSDRQAYTEWFSHGVRLRRADWPHS
eukprot:6749627-Prymnesium_polylepis.2